VTARHLKYTIPPAVVLTWLYRPFFTKLDVYKVVYLISVCEPAAAEALR
jgi:15-cis-phytoene synthase/lycopene beta-cyclase